MLETLCQRHPFDEHGIPKSLIKRVIGKIILQFSCSQRDYPDFFTEKITKTSFELVLRAIRLHHIGMHQLIPLVDIFFHLPQTLNANALKTVSQFRNHCGQTLLHFVCISGDVYFGHLYTKARLLLNAGCDPNATDENGNTPLHYLAQLEKPMLSDWNNTAHLLLDFGAQLNLKNLDGKTAVDFWIQKNVEKKPSDGDEDPEIIDWKLPDWCSELSTLMSLCARVMHRKRIPYLDLPSTIISMIEKHKIIRMIR